MKIKQPFKNIISVLVVTTLLILIVIMAQNNNTKRLAQETQIISAQTTTYKIINFENGTEGKGQNYLNDISKNINDNKFYLIKDSEEDKDRESNTEYLQEAINTASDSVKVIIYVPKGIYYFMWSGSTNQGNLKEHWVIQCKDNVTIIGKGTGENGTILKPYGKVEERWYRHVFL